jgi:hypothetical protein
MGSLHHDDPLLTTASQARHAPRAVSPMNRVRRLPDQADLERVAHKGGDSDGGLLILASASNLHNPKVSAMRTRSEHNGPAESRPNFSFHAFCHGWRYRSRH